MEKKKVLLRCLYGESLRQLIDKANEYGIEREEIVKIISHHTGHSYLIYYR